MSFSLAALVPLLAGCGQEPAAAGDVGAAARALTDTSDPGQEFGSKEGPLDPTTATNDIVHTSDPALCSNEIATFLAVSVDAQGLYRTLFNDQEVRPGSWGNYGSKQFSSRPACAMREQGASGGRGFVLVGRGKDNVLYASPGSWDPHMHDGTPQNPTADAPWAAVSSTVFATGGSPALATNDTTTVMALAYIDSNGLVTVRPHALPYTTHSWGAAVQAPAVGGGWTTVGTPAIVYLPQTTKMFQVVVRVIQRGFSNLLMSYFDPARSRFSGPTAGSSPSWTTINVAVAPDSDPALAYSPTLSTTTLYYRAGSQLQQTSGFAQALGTNQLHAVVTNAGVSYPAGVNGAVGASPSALSLPFENSNNVVVARTTTNKLWTSFSVQDAWLVP